MAKNNKANNGKLEEHMEGYIADAESLKRTFIKSLSTYLKISMSDLAPKKNGPEDKIATQIAVQAVPAPAKKQKILIEESEVQVPLKSNPRDASLLSSSSSGSSSNLLKFKTSSSSSSTAAVTATTAGASAGAGAGVSNIVPSVIEKKAAKYCRETFRDLLSQVRMLSIQLPFLVFCLVILPYVFIYSCYSLTISLD